MNWATDILSEPICVSAVASSTNTSYVFSALASGRGAKVFADNAAAFGDDVPLTGTQTASASAGKTKDREISEIVDSLKRFDSWSIQ